MKKLLFSLLVTMAVGLGAQAQTTVQKSKTEKKDGVTKVEKETSVTTKNSKTVAKEGVVLKNDGTPDKRYKEKVHVKKDGTPDRRYKENKK